MRIDHEKYKKVIVEENGKDTPPKTLEEVAEDERSHVVDVPEIIKKYHGFSKSEMPKKVLNRVKIGDTIRFSRAGQVGYYDGEMIGWEGEGDTHLKVEILDDDGQKTGNVRTYHKADISAVKIVKQDVYN